MGNLITYGFLAIAGVWMIYEFVHWLSEEFKPLGLNKIFMGWFRACIAFVAFWIIYWIITPFLDAIIPQTDFGTVILTILIIAICGTFAGLTGSFLLFKWLRNAIFALFKKFPGGNKMKLFIIAIIILIIAILVFM